MFFFGSLFKASQRSVKEYQSTENREEGKTFPGQTLWLILSHKQRKKEKFYNIDTRATFLDQNRLNGAKDRSKTFIKSVQLKNKKRGLWVEASHPYFSVVYFRLIL